MRGGALVVLIMVAGCDAPSVQVDVDDAGVDSIVASDGSTDDASIDGADTRDPSIRLPDGATCRDHDEDLDGVPDPCDDCPGFGDPEQLLLPATAIGNECKPLAPFDRARTRDSFDPFTHYGDWIAFAGGEGAFAIDGKGEDLVGGIGSDQDFRFLLTKKTWDTTTVVTTVFDARPLGNGGRQTGGILLRATGESKRFLYCFRGEVSKPSGEIGRIFGIAIAPPEGCTGAPCTLTTLVPALIPAEFSESAPIGLRASITTGAGDATTGTMECRVFDPTPTASHAVHNGDPRFSVKVDLDATQFLRTGAIGIGAWGCHISLRWLDVLVEPPAVSP